MIQHPEGAAATVRYMRRLVDLLAFYVENGEADKVIMTLYTLDQAVSPDKQVGIYFIASVITPDALDALRVVQPDTPEITEAKEQLAAALRREIDNARA